MKRTTRYFFGTSLAALLVVATLHLLMLIGMSRTCDYVCHSSHNTTLHLLMLIGMSRVWPALIHLTLFGWISGMIFAVNYHTMPVFSARDFPAPRLIAAHWATFTIGVMLATTGFLGRWPTIVSIGLLLQLIAALLFVANTILLFRRGIPRPHRAPVPPTPDQPQVDRVGTRATKSAGVCLPLALLLLLAEQRDWISGAWLLAGEHLLTLGWIMLMIVGVAYHVLPRFSGRAVRGAIWARMQVQCHRAALMLIVAALGFGLTWLFAFGALLMTTATALFAWTIWPTLEPIRHRSQLVQITFKERTS